MSKKSKRADADYEVGYGKPPKARQFKKGESGNPRGRPPKSKNMNTLLDEELDRLITLRDGNGVRQISTREAIVKQMIQDALKGDLRQLQFLFRHLESRNDPEPFWTCPAFGRIPPSRKSPRSPAKTRAIWAASSHPPAVRRAPNRMYPVRSCMCGTPSEPTRAQKRKDQIAEDPRRGGEAKDDIEHRLPHIHSIKGIAPAKAAKPPSPSAR